MEGPQHCCDRSGSTCHGRESNESAVGQNPGLSVSAELLAFPSPESSTSDQEPTCTMLQERLDGAPPMLAKLHVPEEPEEGGCEKEELGKSRNRSLVQRENINSGVSGEALQKGTGLLAGGNHTDAPSAEE